MLLFRSEGHVEAWCEASGRDRGAEMTVDQQWDLARIWYADRALPGWRRRTPEEAQQVFELIGLTGDFWRLQPA
jgi:hypothetical protein